MMLGMEPIKAAIYVRVSKDDTRKRRSVGQQEEECRARCADEGFLVDEKLIFCDNDRSASRFGKKPREAYEDLLACLRAGSADVLVLWEASRGDRELERWAGLLNLCRRTGILIHVVKDRRTYDLSVSRDWKTLAEDGLDSAYESEKTRDRILRNVRANAEKGGVHGRIPYGYARKYDERTGELVAQVIREDQAQYIREAAERVASGQSCFGIAKDFNARGISAPAGGTWDLKQISRMVTNPTYIGKRMHKGVDMGSGMWEAVLDKATFELCVSLVSDPARRTNHDLAVKHLLSGIAKCGVCGDKARLLKNRGILSYLCDTSFHTAIKQSRLDEYVTDKVKERLYLTDVTKIYDDEDSERRTEAKQKADDLQAQLEDALRQYTNPAPGEERLSAAMLARIESTLQPQMDEQLRLTKSVAIPKVVVKVVGNPELWDDLDMPERRELLRSIVKIEILPIGKGIKNYSVADRVRLSDPRTGKVWTQ